MNLLTRGALALARLIKARTVSAREVVDAHIARIEQVNPKINAVVWTCFERARREADSVDLSLPLAGVPFTVKEMIALSGCRHAAGSWHRRDRLAVRDATAVARLRAPVPSRGVVLAATLGVAHPITIRAHELVRQVS